MAIQLTFNSDTCTLAEIKAAKLFFQSLEIDAVESIKKKEAPEPKAEPKAEAPKAPEPKAPEPKAPEPKAEAPKAPEPKAPEPKAESKAKAERKPKEPKADSPKAITNDVSVIDLRKLVKQWTEAGSPDEVTARATKVRPMLIERYGINNLAELTQEQRVDFANHIVSLTNE